MNVRKWKDLAHFIPATRHWEIVFRKYSRSSGLLFITYRMQISRSWFVNEISVFISYVNSPKSEEYLCHLTLELLFPPNHCWFFINTFFFNCGLLWPKRVNWKNNLTCFKDSNRAVICLINHITVSQIYSNMWSLNKLYITSLMVM